jgi:hypothetical protein
MMRPLFRIAVSLMFFGLGAASPAHAQLSWADILFFTPPPEQPIYTDTLLAKGKADECFDGIGVDYPPINTDGTCDVGTPKKNLAYVWGLTQAGLGVPSFTGDQIWFGTIANPICQGAAVIFNPTPEQNISWVCEYGKSELARRAINPLPPIAGDWRLPHAYSYNLQTGIVTDRTPPDINFASLDGIRSAASLGNAVLMAGPTLQHNVIFAVWDASNGIYKGSCRAIALNNIRQWITVHGTLYAAAGLSAGGGAILRWVGSVDNPYNGTASVSDYCGFEIVGKMPGFPAYVTSYDDKRLVVSVWNKNRRQTESATTAASSDQFAAGIYIGPLFDVDGTYTPADATKPWKRIWAPLVYETDPVVASTVGSGAIAYWKGYLWWGTIHNTLGTMQAHETCTLPICYGPTTDQNDLINLLFNVSRASTIWRAKLIPDGGVQMDLLYGETELPALVPGTKTFEMKSTGWTPLWGSSGFDNPFLTYAWSVSAGPNDLLFGFYDYRYVFDVRFGTLPQFASKAAAAFRARGGITPFSNPDPSRGYGADLWRFDSPDAAGKPETVSGLGNWTNYGIRNMLRLDNGPNVIVGTASGLNLEPAAGWELHQLTAPAQ